MAKKANVDVVNTPDLVAAFTGYLLRLRQEERRLREGECKLSMVGAEGLARACQYEDAQARFAEAISHLVGSQLKVPLEPANGGGVRNPVYMHFTMDECITAMTCCNGAATCLSESNKLLEALDWTTEVDVLHKNMRFAAKPILDWQIFHPSPPSLEFHRQRLLGLVTASDVLLKLGNTGSAAYCRNLGNNIMTSLPSAVDELSLRRELLPMSSIQSIMQHRHPDPTIYRSLELTNPELQVRGSWQRLKWADSSRLTSRMAHACFIYKSRLYVCGGQRSGTIEVYRDVWCLDLVKMDGWRELPSYQRPFLNCQMVVHDGKAYLFRGSSTVDYLDLEKERWGRIQTHLVNARGNRLQWPYTKGLTDYTAHAVHGKIYIFGGKDTQPLGSNLFMVLDIASKTWRHLSGTPDVDPLQPQHDEPGIRKNLASWVDEKGDKLYIMYGMADRQAAPVGSMYAASGGFVYDDCWSWDIVEGRWQRERVVGNFPCPRAEVSVCYNPRTKQTMMFGGYNPALPFFIEGSRTSFGFNYFSDTFVLDHTAPGGPRWKQVLTGNFPTYRAQGQLLADPATGRTYLFGGYTNTDWVPAGKQDFTRSYGDVWQLRVNVPGGLFEEVDWEDERRAAQLGPWMTCYTCGSIGVWKKCAGTCDGRVFFCTPKCQKDGWPEHKQKHACKTRKY